MKIWQPAAVRRAFTLIELLVVIAIIAILAAILFPTFAVAREQARQSDTMSKLHAVYVGVSLFYQDEGHYPSSLFGYAEIPDASLTPPYRPAVPADPTNKILPMEDSHQTYLLYTGSVDQGYLYHEQIKDYITFTNMDQYNKLNTDVTTAYWPLNSPISIALGGTAAAPIQVMWTADNNPTACGAFGDRDLPNGGYTPGNYAGQPKLFYVKDTMDIGPMLDTTGKIVYQADGVTPKYELHYSTDWTHLLGAACDKNASGNPIVDQMKYKLPPTDRTVITYVTQHMDTAKSGKVMVLLLSGNARKEDAVKMASQLPLNYLP